ncbi:MAG TPA: histidinol-phosphate transaminase [Saprospiraceae bacterium]|nr:histidinol-phosphate transaminase [Saprospiraceae bacterium]HPI07398.1 histidinol-phosphate transaminase [Saprospiraceae bacterium]
MNEIEKYISGMLRPGIAALKPYSSARDEFTGAASVFLDANENSLGGPLEEDFSRYPDPLQMPLRQALASLKSVEPGQIFIGNGSDEAIDMLMRAFVEPGRDNIVLLPPTYGMYSVQANIHGAEIRRAPLHTDFSPDADAVLSVSDVHSKLLFLCSPNNPTGQCLPEDFILEMLAKFPGLVVIDEAYGDFSGRPSWTTRLAEFPNLVVMQTLSKAWGLAGLRIGMAFSNAFIINALNKIKYPYNLNSMTIRLALQALQQPDSVQEKVRILLAERERLEQALPLLPCVEKVFPSDANFLLVRVTNADDIYRYLCAQGIIVRNRTKEMHCLNCLRITVGTPGENDLLVTALLEVREEEK